MSPNSTEKEKFFIQTDKKRSQLFGLVFAKKNNSQFVPQTSATETVQMCFANDINPTKLFWNKTKEK